MFLDKNSIFLKINKNKIYLLKMDKNEICLFKISGGIIFLK